LPLSVCSSIVGTFILIALVYLFVHRRYIDFPFLSSAIVDILIALVCLIDISAMDKQTQTRAINIPTMDKQTDEGNQYTYDGRTDRQGQSIYLRWTNKRSLFVHRRHSDCPCLSSSIVGILIILVCLLFQRRYIDCPCLSTSIVCILIALECRRYIACPCLPTKEEQTDNFKGNQYTCDGRTDRQRQSIYL
jgi:hypothetical protein